MKKRFKIIALISLVTLSTTAFTQGPPDPDPDPTGGNNDVGGTAPVGSGITILMVLGSMYASRKIYLITDQNTQSD